MTAVARLAWGGWGVEASLPDEVREGETWRAPQRARRTPSRRWLGGGTWRVDTRATLHPSASGGDLSTPPDLLEDRGAIRRAATALALDVEEADIVEVDGHRSSVPRDR